MLKSNEKNKSAILIDFELAKDMLNEVSLTTTGEPVGTPLYMAPEQFDDSRDVTPETDIYSFGIILYEMLSGEVPFKVGNWPKLMNAHMQGAVPNVREINPDLPEGIEKIIFKALEKEPGDRYRNAKEFWTALSKVEETQKDQASKDKKKKRGQKDEYEIKIEKKRRLKERIEILGVIVTIIGIVVGILTLFNPFQPDNNLVLQRGYIESANKFIQDGDFGKATEALNKAKKIEDTEDLRKLSETIANKQRKSMRNDFVKLKTFLKGTADKNEKMNQCRQFLNIHANVPINEETRSMIADIYFYKNEIRLELEEWTPKVEKVEKWTPKVERPELTEEEIFQRQTLEELNRMGYLKTIYFDYDMYYIRDDMIPVLRKSADWLLRHPTIDISIIAHTDEDGSFNYLKDLGIKRAETVKTYLISLGVSAERIKTGSYWYTIPLGKSVIAASRFGERKVEFFIIKM